MKYSHPGCGNRQQFDRGERDAWMKIRNLTLITVLALVIEKPFYRHLLYGKSAEKYC
jgi:hypothetical protein